MQRRRKDAQRKTHTGDDHSEIANIFGIPWGFFDDVYEGGIFVDGCLQYNKFCFESAPAPVVQVARGGVPVLVRRFLMLVEVSFLVLCVLRSSFTGWRLSINVPPVPSTRILDRTTFSFTRSSHTLFPIGGLPYLSYFCHRVVSALFAPISMHCTHLLSLSLLRSAFFG